MRVLLDTSVFLLLAFAPEHVPSFIRDAVDTAESAALSVASAWEIAIKSSIGKLSLPTPAAEYVPSRAARFGLDLLAIDVRHATAVEALPFHHRDPFDRLLIAQALTDSFVVATTDRIFSRYGVPTVKAS